MNVSASSPPDISCRIALIDSHAAMARPVLRVLRAAGGRVAHVGVDEVGPAIDDADIIVVNIDSVSPASCRRLLQLADGGPTRSRILAYSSVFDRSSLAELFGEHGLTNLLASSPSVDPGELLVTIRKMLSGDIFGLDKYFPWGVTTASMSLRETPDVERAVSMTSEFASNLGLKRRRIDRLTTVTEELVTNALYNAPVDSEGNPKFSHLQRDHPVGLDGDAEIAFRLTSDGERIGMSVSDPFGTLSTTTVLQYLGRCFRRGSDQISRVGGGAGLGLFFVIEGLSHFAVNISPDKRTEVIGLVDISVSYREFAERPKSFNIFVAPT